MPRFSRMQSRLERAWGSLAEGWRQLHARSSDALTHFVRRTAPGGRGRKFPEWSLLAGEVWETERSVIVRLELPGMTKEDIDVTVVGNVVRIRGDKRSEGERTDRHYYVMERAYGRFEREFAIPASVTDDEAEVCYKDGVLTAIFAKTEPAPPRQITVR